MVPSFYSQNRRLPLVLVGATSLGAGTRECMCCSARLSFVQSLTRQVCYSAVAMFHFFLRMEQLRVAANNSLLVLAIVDFDSTIVYFSVNDELSLWKLNFCFWKNWNSLSLGLPARDRYCPCLLCVSVFVSSLCDHSPSRGWTGESELCVTITHTCTATLFHTAVERQESERSMVIILTTRVVFSKLSQGTNSLFLQLLCFDTIFCFFIASSLLRASCSNSLYLFLNSGCRTGWPRLDDSMYSMESPPDNDRMFAVRLFCR